MLTRTYSAPRVQGEGQGVPCTIVHREASVLRKGAIAFATVVLGLGVVGFGQKFHATNNVVEHNANVSAELAEVTEALKHAGRQPVYDSDGSPIPELIDDDALLRLFRKCASLRNVSDGHFVQQVLYPSLRTQVSEVAKDCSDLARLDSAAALKQSQIKLMGARQHLRYAEAQRLARTFAAERAMAVTRKERASRIVSANQIREGLKDWR